MAKLRIAGIVPESVVDGPGFRYTVFTQGCRHNCKGCHNPQTHDFNGGYIVDTDDLFAEMMERMGKKDCSGGYEESLRYMLKKNIVCGDALTYRTAEGKSITFCEWTPIAGSMQFLRRDFQFDFLVTQSHQYSLFDEQGEAQNFDEPVRTYPPLHYTQLYRYEEQL